MPEILDMTAPGPNHFPFMEVDEQDVKLLKSLQRELNHNIRLHWQPAATTRGSAPQKPTHVTIVSDDPAWAKFAAHEVIRDREKRIQTEESPS